jgi:hypothetical protein
MKGVFLIKEYVNSESFEALDHKSTCLWNASKYHNTAVFVDGLGDKNNPMSFSELKQKLKLKIVKGYLACDHTQEWIRSNMPVMISKEERAMLIIGMVGSGSNAYVAVTNYDPKTWRVYQVPFNTLVDNSRILGTVVPDWYPTDPTLVIETYNGNDLGESSCSDVCYFLGKQFKNLLYVKERFAYRIDGDWKFLSFWEMMSVIGCFLTSIDPKLSYQKNCFLVMDMLIRKYAALLLPEDDWSEEDWSGESSP